MGITAPTHFYHLHNRHSRRETSVSQYRIVGALAGLATGNAPGAIAGGIVVGGTSLAINKIMNSTWFNTLRAVQKNKIATRLLKMSPAVRNKWIVYISRQGNKGVDRLFKDQQNPQITQPNK